jgi:hypothetical protein
MKELVYRDPLGGPKRFAKWLNELRNLSGAYVIRKKGSHEILYVGESHTGHMAKTIKRHFYKWDDDGNRKHFTVSPSSVEIAVRLTPPNAAVGTQNNLIRRLNPSQNTQGVPF